jgi:hypothetical protein
LHSETSASIDGAGITVLLYQSAKRQHRRTSARAAEV